MTLLKKQLALGNNTEPVFWKKGEFKWWILLICTYHFFPFITLKLNWLMYIICYFVPLLYTAVNYKILIKAITSVIKSDLLYSFAAIGALTGISLLLPVFYNTGDFTYFNTAILTFVKILIRMLFLFVLIKKNIPSSDCYTFIKYYIFSCCIYICSTFVVLVFPALRDVIANVVSQPANSVELMYDDRYKTRIGWAGFSGFEYTFKCTLACLFNCIFIIKHISEKKIFMPICVSVFLLIGTLFYGRIGLLISGIIVAVMFVFIFMKYKQYGILAVETIVSLFLIVFILKNFIPAIKTSYDWALEPIISLLKKGTLSTYSTSILFNRMLFLPDIKTILSGDGLFTVGDAYYMHTDSGIMRTLLFGGLLTAALRYFPLFFSTIRRFVNKQFDKTMSFLLIAVLAVCAVFEVKGEVIFSCLPIMAIVFLAKDYDSIGNNSNADLFNLFSFLVRKWYVFLIGTGLIVSAAVLVQKMVFETFSIQYLVYSCVGAVVLITSILLLFYRNFVHKLGYDKIFKFLKRFSD